MKAYAPEHIHNVCLAGARGSGKTTLADAAAFNTKVNSRIGSVDDESSLFDYTEADIKHKTSLSLKLLAAEWSDRKINLFDCPGHPDFVGELVAAARVCDSACFVIDAAAGAEVGTQLQWRSLSQSHIARFFFVNKMEKENVNWQATLESLKTSFGKQAVAVTIPIGQSESFKGIVDLLHMKAYEFDGKGGRKEIPIPDDLKDEAESERSNLIEVAAEADDALIEKYFDAGTLSDEDIRVGFVKGLVEGTLYPVLFGSAQKNMGVRVLMDFVAQFAPTPKDVPTPNVFKTGSEDLVELPVDQSAKTVAYVFKTASESHMGEMSFLRVLSGTIKPGGELVNQQTSTSERPAQLYSFQGKNRVELQSIPAGDIGVLVKLKGTATGSTITDKGADFSVPAAEFPNPVMDVAIKPAKAGDEDKVASGLAKLNAEDPTFRVVQDAALHQMVLYAQGSTQIEILLEKLQQRYNVGVELARPRVPYRETIRGKSEVQYRHKKQSGGRGQFGDVHLRLEPNERGAGFQFINEITGGVIPTKYIPAVEKGVVEAMAVGPLSGSQVVDVKATVYYGSYHEVDSSDMAFKIAASQAFRNGFADSKPVLLEPIFDVEVLVPEAFTGDVMGDMSSRRGKIAGMEPDGTNQKIKAQVPQAEMYNYSVDLRSMTQGQGVFSLTFSHYEQVPHDAAQKVIDEYTAQREAEHAA